MIKAEIRGEIKFPDFVFVEELEEIANNIFVPILVRNIDRQQDLTEKPFPPLADSTIKSKTRRHSLSLGPLIDSGKLRGAFRVRRVNNKTVVVTIDDSRKKIGGILQNEGTFSKQYGLRFWNFFGISSRMEFEAIKYMKKIIKDYVRNAGR